MWHAWDKGAYRVFVGKSEGKTLALMGNNIKIDVH
jgi:hypothetical protein